MVHHESPLYRHPILSLDSVNLYLARVGGILLYLSSLLSANYVLYVRILPASTSITPRHNAERLSCLWQMPFLCLFKLLSPVSS
jgi:hypothetical protein